jgi:putative glutamine amidotransferase
MAVSATPPRIAIYGPEEAPCHEGRGCGLWPAGYAAALGTAGATPVFIKEPAAGASWNEVLDGAQGVILTGESRSSAQPIATEERLCRWCRKEGVPLLAVDQGLHALNATFGGSLYLDLAREMPDALQHRHPPERGLRHAINVTRGTRLAQIYGEGELVVNSEHRRAICRVARGFRVCAEALDGVIEAIETDNDTWFAIGVQWRPASGTASGLDIQLFRGLIEACGKAQHKRTRAAYSAAA